MRRGYDYDIEQYKSAVKLMSYDGSIMWNIMQVFLLPQSIILTYLLTTPFARAVMRTIDNARGVYANAENIGPLLLKWNPQIFFIALFCFVLCIPWFFLCNRSIASYDFSAINARYLEPEGWKVIGGERTRYFKGKRVKIGRESLKLKWHSRIKIRRTSTIIIGVFVTTFLALAVVSSPLSEIINILREVKMVNAWFVVLVVGIVCGVLIVRMEYLRRIVVIKKGEKNPVNRSKGGLLVAGSVLLAIGLSFFSTHFFVKLEGWLWFLGFLFSFVGLALISCYSYLKRSRKQEKDQQTSKM